MWRRWIALPLLLAAPVAGQPGTSPKAVVADLDTEVHAVSADFVARTIRDAGTARAPFVVLRINTPGGRLDSTREITQAILGSKVPVVGYVTPPGAQAASAGFLVLMACDVAAMAPGTNAGAASPVGGSGEDLPKTIGKKVTEDASALLRSVVGPRGRPVEPAVLTITEAVSYSEVEAGEKKLIEIVARDLPDLFRQLDGRTIKRVGKPDSMLKTAGVSFRVVEMTGLQKALGVVANPALAGILFLIGLAGLYAEMQHPGAIFPGVLGGIALLLALFAMSVLPTSYAGVALVLLGILFFFLEVQLAGHGLFAVGGAIAIVLGAALLFHQDPLAPRNELWIVIAGAVMTAGVLAVLSWKALSLMRLPQRTGASVLIGQVVAARSGADGGLKVFADGALWSARSALPVAEGEMVEIVGMDGLSVIVRPKVRSA